jgi:hypothetical protein
MTHALRHFRGTSAGLGGLWVHGGFEASIPSLNAGNLGSFRVFLPGMNDNTPVEEVHSFFSEATILDRDNRLLAIGKARIYPTLHAGVFWPQELTPAPALSNCAAWLRAKDATYQLSRVVLCPHHKGKPNHFDFEFV